MSTQHARSSSSEYSCVSNPSGTPANHINHRGRLALLLLHALLVVVALLLAACGPERRDSTEIELESATVGIAQAFAQDGNADQARGRLHDLDVANPMQWLVYLTETAISESRDADETRSLAGLAIALGSQSHAILDFGVQAGIMAGKAKSVQAAPMEVNAAHASQPDSESVEPEAPTVVPTVAVIALEPTQTPDVSGETEAALQPPAETPQASPTAIPVPRVVASTSLNVRSGPGTAYPIVQALGAGENAEIVAKNGQSDWWQVQLDGEQLGWVYGPLVETSGDLGTVAVAANIPEPPPTATPAPVVEAPPVEEAPPAEEAPPQEEAPPPANDGPDFVVIEKRLWDVYENGGFLSGPTVTCGEKRQLVVNVVDANGSRINGIAVQEEFGAKGIEVTGAQGKGDGVAEFILGRGQDVKVVRDSDGREVTSEVARGMVTEPAGIPYELLIAGQYCSDDASCKSFVDAPGCWGHYSWTVTFQRKY